MLKKIEIPCDSILRKRYYCVNCETFRIAILQHKENKDYILVVNDRLNHYDDWTFSEMETAFNRKIEVHNQRPSGILGQTNCKTPQQRNNQKAVIMMILFLKICQFILIGGAAIAVFMLVLRILQWMSG